MSMRFRAGHPRAMAVVLALVLSAPIALAGPAYAGDVPSSPTFVEGVQVDEGVVGVIWDPPTNPGSTPLVSYTATASPGGLTCTTTDMTPGEEFCFIENLTVGESYTFTVVATNSDGASPPSAPSPATKVYPYVVPGAPTSLAWADAAFSINVSWAAPTNAGPPVLGYIATAQPGGLTCVSLTTTCSWPALWGGTYTVTVVAVNDVGASVASAPFGPLAFVAPQGPTAVAVGTTSSAATVSWAQSPATAYPITYTATFNPGGRFCTSAGTTCDVFGLSSATDYSVSVIARNQVGASAPSASVVTRTLPAPLPRDTTPPAAVTGLNAAGQIAANGSVGARLTWTAAADVTRVLVSVRPVTGVTILPTTTTSLTSADVSGLRAGVSYWFDVVPMDAAGNTGGGTRITLNGTTVGTSAPATSVAGRAVPVRFQLRDLGLKPLTAKPVDILVRPNAAAPWRVYRRMTTNALGGVAVTLRLNTTTQFALRYAGEVGLSSVPAGGLVTVRVSAAVSARMAITPVPRVANVARRGSRVTLTGVVGPNKRGQLVYLQKLVGSTWQNVASVKLGLTSNYGFVLPTTARGTATYRVLRPADRVNLAGSSAQHVLTVR